MKKKMPTPTGKREKERECEHQANVPSKTTLTSMFAPRANFTITVVQGLR